MGEVAEEHVAKVQLGRALGGWVRWCAHRGSARKSLRKARGQMDAQDYVGACVSCKLALDLADEPDHDHDGESPSTALECADCVWNQLEMLLQDAQSKNAQWQATQSEVQSWLAEGRQLLSERQCAAARRVFETALMTDCHDSALTSQLRIGLSTANSAIVSAQQATDWVSKQIAKAHSFLEPFRAQYQYGPAIECLRRCAFVQNADALLQVQSARMLTEARAALAAQTEACHKLEGGQQLMVLGLAERAVSALQEAASLLNGGALREGEAELHDPCLAREVKHALDGAVSILEDYSDAASSVKAYLDLGHRLLEADVLICASTAFELGLQLALDLLVASPCAPYMVSLICGVYDGFHKIRWATQNFVLECIKQKCKCMAAEDYAGAVAALTRCSLSSMDLNVAEQLQLSLKEARNANGVWLGVQAVARTQIDEANRLLACCDFDAAQDVFQAVGQQMLHDSSLTNQALRGVVRANQSRLEEELHKQVNAAPEVKHLLDTGKADIAAGDIWTALYRFHAGRALTTDQLAQIICEQMRLAAHLGLRSACDIGATVSRLGEIFFPPMHESMVCVDGLTGLSCYLRSAYFANWRCLAAGHNGVVYGIPDNGSPVSISPPRSVPSSVAAALLRGMPKLTVSALGREMTSATFDNVTSEYAVTHRLDPCCAQLCELTSSAAIELLANVLGYDRASVHQQLHKSERSCTTESSDRVVQFPSLDGFNDGTRAAVRMGLMQEVEHVFTAVSKSGLDLADFEKFATQLSRLQELPKDEFARTDDDNSGSIDLAEASRWWLAQRQGNAPGRNSSLANLIAAALERQEKQKKVRSKQTMKDKGANKMKTSTAEYRAAERVDDQSRRFLFSQPLQGSSSVEFVVAQHKGLKPNESGWDLTFGLGRPIVDNDTLKLIQRAPSLKDFFETENKRGNTNGFHMYAVTSSGLRLQLDQRSARLEQLESQLSHELESEVKQLDAAERVLQKLADNDSLIGKLDAPAFAPNEEQRVILETVCSILDGASYLGNARKDHRRMLSSLCAKCRKDGTPVDIPERICEDIVSGAFPAAQDTPTSDFETTAECATRTLGDWVRALYAYNEACMDRRAVREGTKLISEQKREVDDARAALVPAQLLLEDPTPFKEGDTVRISVAACNLQVCVNGTEIWSVLGVPPNLCVFVAGGSDMDIIDAAAQKAPVSRSYDLSSLERDMDGQSLVVCLNWVDRCLPSTTSVLPLHHINLSSLGLQELPPALTDAKQLQGLIARSNRLKHLPAWLLDLTLLESLDVRDNPLCAGGLTRERLLDTHKKLSSTLDEAAAIADTAKTENATLKSGHTSLTTLDISRSTKVSMPDLLELPGWVLEYPSLTNLNAGGIGLTALPSDIGTALPALTSVDVSNNNLAELPPSLGLIDTLTSLNVHGNKRLASPPADVIKSNVSRIKSFLRGVYGGSRAVFKTKLMLVGIGGVGKTSVGNVLRGKNHDDHGRVSTDGIDITPWDVVVDHNNCPRHRGRFQGKVLTLSLWDFAGQDEYYATHQFFLKPRAVYIVVWNVRSGMESSSVEMWLDMIKTYAPQAPIIVVGTRIDEVPMPGFDEEKFKRRYNITKFIGVSTTQNQNVDELREHVIEVALNESYMGESVKTQYLRLEEQVANQRKRHHVTRKEMRRMCYDSGITGPTQQDEAIAFHADLGTLVHFNDTRSQRSGLDHLVILDTQWIIHVLACIITAQTGEYIIDGRFYHDKLGSIWPDKDDIPQAVSRKRRDKLSKLGAMTDELRAQLLKMTGAMELIMEVKSDTSDKRYMVPCLLSDTPESLVYQEVSVICSVRTNTPHNWTTFREWKFEFMPAGAFARVLYRIQDLADDDPVMWQSGIIMGSQTGHRAFIECSRVHRTMKASVRGSHPQSLLGKISDAVESLCQTYVDSNGGTTINMTTLIPCESSVRRGVENPHMFEVDASIREAFAKPSVQCLQNPTTFEEIPVNILMQSVTPKSLPELQFQQQAKEAAATEMQCRRSASRIEAHDKFSGVAICCDADLMDSTDFAHTIFAHLHSHRLQLWVDIDHLGDGDNAHARFTAFSEALTKAKFMFACVSKAFCSDHVCLLQLEHARRLEVPIILVTIDEVTDTELARVHFLKFKAVAAGEVTEEEFCRLHANGFTPIFSFAALGANRIAEQTTAVATLLKSLARVVLQPSMERAVVVSGAVAEAEAGEEASQGAQESDWWQQQELAHPPEQHEQSEPEPELEPDEEGEGEGDEETVDPAEIAAAGVAPIDMPFRHHQLEQEMMETVRHNFVRWLSRGRDSASLVPRLILLEWCPHDQNPNLDFGDLQQHRFRLRVLSDEPSGWAVSSHPGYDLSGDQRRRLQEHWADVVFYQLHLLSVLEIVHPTLNGICGGQQPFWQHIVGSSPSRFDDDSDHHTKLGDSFQAMQELFVSVVGKKISATQQYDVALEGTDLNAQITAYQQCKAAGIPSQLLGDPEDPDQLARCRPVSAAAYGNLLPKLTSDQQTVFVDQRPGHRYSTEPARVTLAQDEKKRKTQNERAQDLHAAIEEHDETLVANLLLHQASRRADHRPAAAWTTSNSPSVTALHRAARKGNLGIVKLLLLQPEAIIRQVINLQTTVGGYSALHWSCEYGHTKIARLLIEKECDTSLKNDRQKTAWDLAEQYDKQSHGTESVAATFKNLANAAPSAENRPYARLYEEQQNRTLRPDVQDTFRDDLELDYRRFTLWHVRDVNDCAGTFQLWGEDAEGKIKPVGEGGFSKVYLVKDVSPAIRMSGTMLSDVVLKVPKQDPQAINDLKEEVTSLSNFVHQNLVQILGMVRGLSPDGEDAWMMCLEFCQTDLKKVIYDKKDDDEYSLELMATLAEQVLNALVYIHAENTPHLDIKPCVSFTIMLHRVNCL